MLFIVLVICVGCAVIVDLSAHEDNDEKDIIVYKTDVSGKLEYILLSNSGMSIVYIDDVPTKITYNVRKNTRNIISDIDSGDRMIKIVEVEYVLFRVYIERTLYASITTF